MKRLNISLFGKLCIQLDKELLNFEGQKLQELFCYLLLYRDRPHHREALANLLWDDVSNNRSRDYLRKTLWQLQTSIKKQIDPLDCDILLLESDWIRINPAANIRLDVAIFEEEFSLIHGLLGRELKAATVKTLQKTINLYRGELLEGWYQGWCLYERERFQRMFMNMLDKLIEYFEKQGDYETGLVYCAHILHHDIANERTHRRVMRLQYLKGNRTEALRQYEYCQKVLNEELGVKPSQQTTMLYQQIKVGSLSDAFSPSNLDQLALASIPDSQVGVVKQLQQLRRDLSLIEFQLQQKIEIINQILGDTQSSTNSQRIHLLFDGQASSDRTH